MTGRDRTNAKALGIVPLLLLSAGLLTGCSSDGGGPSLPRLSDLNPFAAKEEKLKGTRVAVLQKGDSLGAEMAAADKPMQLPPEAANDAWSQPGGVASNAPGHLALSGQMRTAWSADAGTGSSSYGKLTASPIVYDGRVYTIDADARVTAFSAQGGGVAWRIGLTPEKEKPHKGFGGGLAADAGRLYATTGFGTVVAIDPKTGKKIWEKGLVTPIRSSPTATGDKVFVITTEGRVFCLAGADGSELWSHRGASEGTGILSDVSPAVDGDFVIVPYPSGDLIALRVSTGQPVWSESLARARQVSSIASLSNAARPVIQGGAVFAVGHAGRMIATAQNSGERLWSASIPGIQAPSVVGDNVFIVDTSGQLLALTRRDGKVRWSAKLPGSSTWSGPVLAGNRLWLTSNTGQLVGVEAMTGKVASQQNVGSPVFIPPVVANGRLYVLTDKARLIAFN